MRLAVPSIPFAADRSGATRPSAFVVAGMDTADRAGTEPM